MSGLCGYFEPDGAPPSPLSLRRMLRPLSQFDQAPQRSVFSARGAIGVAAGRDSGHLFHRDGLLVALWGRPRVDGQEDVASALADLWGIHGPQACRQLRGAFALCIIDNDTSQALLAVDRSGSQALCFQQCGGGLLFASSSDALLAHPRATRELDPQALFDYLYFHTIPAPRTIYQGQQRLRPGEYVLYRQGKCQRAQYWTPEFDEQCTTTAKELQHDFLSAIEQSVRQQATGAGAVGAFLSGGTDSSTIAGMLARLTGSPARTYSIGFDVPGYDEMQYARIAARHFNTLHHEMYVNANDVADAIPRIAAGFDQPYGNASAVPAYYCASMARADGITRLLGGDGGDELFGGNERYARQAVFERYEQIPSGLRQVVLEPALFGLLGKVDMSLLSKARSYVRQALVAMPARLETYNLLQRYGAETALEADFLHQVDVGGPMAQLNECYWRTHGFSQINRMQALDLRYTLADNDLRKVNVACELAGVAAGFPFLSDELMAFSCRLAPHHKLRGTQLRYFFKQALGDFLPRAILRKKKHGFGLPFGHWVQTHSRLRALAYDSLNDLKTRGIVRPDFINDLMQNQLQQHPAYHGTMVWVLMMLEHWFRQHSAANRLPEEVHDGYQVRQG